MHWEGRHQQPAHPRADSATLYQGVGRRDWRSSRRWSPTTRVVARPRFRTPHRCANPHAPLLTAVHHPPIALFVLMPLILGTSIISPLNVLVALTFTPSQLMVRSGVDAFDSAPDSARICTRPRIHAPTGADGALPAPRYARHYGGSPRGNRGKYWRMVSVVPLIGVPLARHAIHRRPRAQYPFEILAGVILSSTLALVLDLLLILLTRALYALASGYGCEPPQSRKEGITRERHRTNLAYLMDGANWQGSTGILVRLLEHLSVTALATPARHSL